MVPAGVVLSVEEVHGAEEVVGRAQNALSAGGAVLMPDDGGRLIAHRPARLPGAQAPVQVLAVHEEALVERTDLALRDAPDQQTGAAHRVHLEWAVRVDERQVVATEDTTAWEEPAEATQPKQRHT